MDNRDNQQVTQTDLAWFAGYLDGEGSFGIYGTRRKDNTLNYGARIQVSSINAESMKKIFYMMKALGISVRLWNKLSKIPKHRDAIYTTVNKLSSLYKLLPMVIPYLTIKKAHAELLFQWVKSRVEKGISRGGNMKKNVYDTTEIATIAALQILNSHRETSETIRGALEVGMI